jgi:hypothetical integral membrane protein (TIGR02206 family)
METVPFQSFSQLHFMPVLFISIACYLIIKFAQKQTEYRQRQIGLVMSLIVLFAMGYRMFIIYLEGSFTIQEELPLHLCRLMAIVMPMLMWWKHKQLLNMFYYLIIAGTLQAVLTPDLNQGPPHYEYYVYFIMHVTLIWIPVYVVMVYKFIPNLRDMVNAFLFTNVYMVFTLIINRLIGSNYLYTSHKPPNGSILDLFGEWPWYLVCAEGIGIVLFLIAYLPFRKAK